ncbi:hypothetical protein AVV41_gp064 [Microcystis phage MaMV-DC]|uniref:Uncharacterized protein n=1 Tax=Microcystis phage MaMV-DC TaxID=1357715 RepID=A0A075BU25_9CAUD|nr:hypothetical protein AVV41_gp064 [Microcystis phage MaMV-DC]AGR48629.1 hypothetical protein MaMVDC_64 [Microcystis phage MaMV-DC]
MTRTQRTSTAKTPTGRSAIDAFKEQPKEEPAKALMLYSVAFSTKFSERIWSKTCADGTIRLVGTVTKINNLFHQGSPISNEMLAGLTVEVRVTPDQFETICDNIADMMGGGVSILFEVGEPSFSVLTVNGEEVNTITFYATSLEGMEVNKTAIGGLSFSSKDALNDFLSGARTQNADRQKRRQAERTSKLQATRAAADAARGNAEWAPAAPAESTNPMD